MTGRKREKPFQNGMRTTSEQYKNACDSISASIEHYDIPALNRKREITRWSQYLYSHNDYKVPVLSQHCSPIVEKLF